MQFWPFDRFDEERVDAGTQSFFLGISTVQPRQGRDDHGPRRLPGGLSHLGLIFLFDATDLSGDLEAIHEGHGKV